MKGEITPLKVEATIHFDGDNSSSPVDLTDQIHQLPCCIKYDGPSPVSHYFKPKPTGIEVDGLNVKEAYFRGRKLQGATIPLPDGYSGFVIRRATHAKRKASETNAETSAETNAEATAEITAEAVDSWEMNAKFQNITYWNHDNLPSKEDAFLRMFHLFEVTKALHKPVTAEDIESVSYPGAIATD